MVDSPPRPSPLSRGAAEYQLSARNQGEWRLTLEADPEWISDPDRVLPVDLGPSLTVPSPSLDCDYLLYGTSTTRTVGCGCNRLPRLRAQYNPPKGPKPKNVNDHAEVPHLLDSIQAPTSTKRRRSLCALGRRKHIDAEMRKVTKEWNGGWNWFKPASAVLMKKRNGIPPAATSPPKAAEVTVTKRLVGIWRRRIAALVKDGLRGGLPNRKLRFDPEDSEGRGKMPSRAACT